MWEEAKRAWPEIDLDAERFRRFLDGRCDNLSHVTDLYLACACLDGIPAALKQFDRLLDEVGRKLRGMAASEAHLEDAKQAVRQVLVARPDKPAPLDDYRGRGELGGWLRIALGRELVRIGKRDAREAPAHTDELAALADADDDPETRYLKAHYQNEFKEAFAAALERIDAGERRLLRYAILERLSIDDIAKLDGIHRATAARQLSRARERLTDETRRSLRERLKVGADELQSILRLIESQVDVSVRRLLA
jgi:RNA polymerase sigma-70 factor (ECF subfamily)